MVSAEKRGPEIRQFILEHVEEGVDIVRLTMQTFGISRQGVHRHIQTLRKQQALDIHGTTRNRRYNLHPLATLSKEYYLSFPLEEDHLWRIDVRSVLGDLPENVLTIWQ